MVRTKESIIRVTAETTDSLSPLLSNTTMKSHYYGHVRPALRHNIYIDCVYDPGVKISSGVGTSWNSFGNSQAQRYAMEIVRKRMAFRINC
jgi:hypothetical protein